MASILPENSVQIRCICSYDHDDNFTIQCERCNAWQHARCVDISDEAAVPDHYLCPECAGTLDTMNIAAARAHQRQFLQLAAQQRAARTRAEQEDEPRKRGRKRSTELENFTESADFPDPKYFNVPISVNTWTPAAALVWKLMKDRVSRLAYKEQRNPVDLRVSRSERGSSDWDMSPSAATLVTPSSLSKGRMVCEILGEVTTKSEYCENKVNQFHVLGAPKKGVVFLPGLPLAIDSRRHGSHAIFLRRSSSPNSKVVVCEDEKGNMRVMVCLVKSVRANTEITLGWHWAPSHPIRQLGENAKIGRELKTILWLLDIPEADCRPAVDEDSGDEQWEDCTDISSTIRDHSGELFPNTQGSTSKGVEGIDFPEEAQEAFVWTPPDVDIHPPPSKKRVSLADYMRSRG